MIYVNIDPKTLQIFLAKARLPYFISFEAKSDNSDSMYNYISDKIYFDIMYPDVRRRDKAKGLNIKHKLAPPSPFEVSLGIIIWQGTIQGFSWDIIKLAVKSAIKSLKEAPLLPAREKSKYSKNKDLVLVLDKYSKGKRQFHLYLGIKNSLKKERISVRNNLKRKTK